MEHPPKKQWTDVISNNVLCNYFYVFFIVFSVWAAVSLVGGIWIFATSKLSFGLLLTLIFNIILSFGISASWALFLYLICERALKPAMAEHGGAAGHGAHEAMENMM